MQTKTCPREIENIVLEILYATMIFIRYCDNLKVAQLTANHAHNLPDLIRNFSNVKLRLYWEQDKLILQQQAHALKEALEPLEFVWKESEPVITKYLNANPPLNP
jgi:uncharacterized membrane protein